jgi:predicted aspartyl protease
MMVLASKSDHKQLIGTTVIEVPSQDGKRHATTVLIDNGFTGYAIMSHSFAENLGYKFQRCKGETYRTATGNMETSFSVKLTDVRLPHLSRNRTFTVTFKIAPAESGDFGYRVIMGIGMMDELGIDQSRTEKKIITRGPDVQVPMVPVNYWTDACIQAICKSAKPIIALSEDQRKETKEPINTNSATKSSSDLFLTTNKPAEVSKMRRSQHSATTSTPTQRSHQEHQCLQRRTRLLQWTACWSKTKALRDPLSSQTLPDSTEK